MTDIIHFKISAISFGIYLKFCSFCQLRKTLNDEQNSKIVSHNQKLVKRKEEIALLDAKIALLQNRLRSSKLQKQNERNGHLFGAVGAAVESRNHMDVRSTVPSDVVKPPSMVESRYQPLPPGKTLPLAPAIKAVTPGYEKENGFARAELEENEKATAMSKKSEFDFILCQGLH